ncbi:MULTISPECIES: hypothetical protein [Bacillus]|uniref:hypothetical protein n=1 Tax=Bacillus TaxID=1386 RepID=UPI000A06FEBE|nr:MULTISPECIES: hypothetical protein [Bacillus]HDR7243154.1 hypothetical protein [Bacillus mobilis]
MSEFKHASKMKITKEKILYIRKNEHEYSFTVVKLKKGKKQEEILFEWITSKFFLLKLSLGISGIVAAISSWLKQFV